MDQERLEQAATSLADQPPEVGFRRLLLRQAPFILMIAGLALATSAVSIFAFTGVDATANRADLPPNGSLVVDNPDVSFGEGLPGQEFSLVYNLRNPGGRPIRVLGCRTTCACIIPEPMPFDIEPGTVRPFRVSLTLSKTPGRKPEPREAARYHLWLFTSPAGQSKPEMTISGMVRWDKHD